ncbi:MAG TPA: hypothetical protein VJT49_10565 [Amycolatopsis sp.]|uniref:hypothetical protein n=1 Tax=Amycolatopsis sp. TaxID=37632 RepID=UPI002B496627|nr:hypothetical protein [Amycolatopsis sp.]HKS45537.1 hypothetical protein [Amycolatopsis sp.]
MTWPRFGKHRTLSDLDANAPAPPRMVPGAAVTRTQPYPKEKPMTAPTRPPRPTHIPADVLAETARAMGMSQAEIIDVTDTDEGRIVTTHDGSKTIIVPADRPDALGQTGVLAYNPPPSIKTPRYVAHGAPADPATSEPWTVADLDLAASKIQHIPAPEGLLGGPTRMGWVGADPIRARAVWLFAAEHSGVTPTVAAHQFAEAGACRRVILASGWLSEREAAAL